MRARVAWPQSCVRSRAPRARTLSERRPRGAGHTEAGVEGRKLDAIDERDAFPGIVGEEEVAVEVDVVAETRHLARRGDGDARLHHAAEHDAEVERPRGVHDPDAL